MMNAQIADDINLFQQATPEEQAAAARKKAEQKKREQELRPEQMKAAEKLTEQLKEEKEAKIKADLIQQGNDYLKLVKEFHPEKWEYMKVKTFTPKMSVEEMRIAIRDIQNELGKKGGLEFAKVLWVEGFKFFEKVNEDKRFGLNVTNLGRVAENSVLPRQLEDGTVVQGPAVPTLAEFCVKHSTWFSTDVDVRLFMYAVNMVAMVHRINEQAPADLSQASTKPVSKETKEKMKNL
jgi:hypothetical protein